ncbi:MAG: response regulator transcription factor [Acidobacteriota bacterium]
MLRTLRREHSTWQSTSTSAGLSKNNPDATAVRLLLVEDEPNLATLLSRRLRNAGYVVDVAGTGKRAIELAVDNVYDVVVLDINLPDCSGIRLLERWRGEGQRYPILILTARSDVRDKIFALDAGADDYLTKPFDYQELLARLRCLLRRRDAEPVRMLKFEDLTFDRTTLQIRRNGTPLRLTAKELALIEYFLLNPGKVLNRTGIADHVWDDRYKAKSNVIDVVVGRLRKKLEAKGGPRLIFTIKGLGYVLQHPKSAD